MRVGMHCLALHLALVVRKCGYTVMFFLISCFLAMLPFFLWTSFHTIPLCISEVPGQHGDDKLQTSVLYI